MISHDIRKAGVRQLEQTIGRAALKMARKVATQESLPERLDQDDLGEFLGPEIDRAEATRQE